MTATADPDLPVLTDPVERPEPAEELLEELEVELEVVLLGEAADAVVVEREATPGIVSALT